MTRRQIRAYVRLHVRYILDPIKKRRQMEALVAYAYYAEKRKICWRVPKASIEEDRF